MAMETERFLINKDEYSPVVVPSTSLISKEDRCDQLKDSSQTVPRFRDVFKQIIISCIASISVIQAGLNMAFSSVLLEQLNNDKNYDVSKADESWIASLAVLTTPIGSVLSGSVMDKMGRKPCLILANVMSLIGWILILLATPSFYLPLILLGRVLGGLGGGMTTVALVYIPEVCHEQYRPMVLGTNSIAVSLGVLFVTLTGYFMDWKMMTCVFCIFILINISILLKYVPESPVWLMTISKNRDLAEESLHQLNSNQELYEMQLAYLINQDKSREHVSKNIDEEGLVKRKVKLIFLQFLTPPAKLPLMILIGLIILQQLCGGYSIIFYAIQVFKKMGKDFGEGMDEYTALLIMGILRFLLSIVSAGVSLFIGRKILLSISALGMAVSSFLIPFYHYIIQENSSHSSKMDDSQWPLIFVLTFVSFSALGIMNIPWTLIGELLPISVRGMASGYLISFAYLLMFTIVKIFPFILDTYNVYTLFLIQGLVCVSITLYVYIFVPETLGKTLHAIQEHFYTNKQNSPRR